MKTIAAIASLALVSAGLSLTAAAPAQAEVMLAGISGSLCMDLNQSTNKVALWACHGGANQNFFTSAYGQQAFNGQCLDAGGDSSDMFMAPCANKPTQHWGMSPSGEWKNESGYCADIPFGIAVQGWRIQMHGCNNGKNQTWARGQFLPGGAQGVMAGGQPGGLYYGGAKIGQSGNQLVAAGGGNLVAAGGGNLVAAGGGNAISLTGGALVAAGGGN